MASTSLAGPSMGASSSTIIYKPILKKTSQPASYPIASARPNAGGADAGGGSAKSLQEQESADLKKVRKVRFNPYVQRVRLPADECEEAQAARKSRIKEAPYHDELWDGDAYCFRERELTPDELWALRIRSKVSSIPRRLSKPIKRGLRALQFLVPGAKPVDLVSAHARKMKDDDVKSTTSTGSGESSPPGEHRFTKVPLLRRQSSLLRGRELALEIEEITPATFERYDELVTLIEAFKGVPNELAEAERNLSDARNQLQQAKDRLRDLRFELPEMERRLARNANPRLLHYVQFSRDDKVRKLEHEYETLKIQKDEQQKKVEKLAMIIYEGNELLEKLGGKLTTLRGAEAEKAALELFVSQEFGENDALLNEIMDTLDECRFNLDKEMSLERKLRTAASTFETQVIKEHLQKAMQALREADAMISLNSGGSGGGGSGLGSSQKTEKRGSSLGSSQRHYPSLFAASSSQSAQQAASVATATHDLSTLARRRRDLIASAREHVFQAVDVLENALDDVEEACRDRWSSHVMDWRKGISHLELDDVFGTSANLLRKRTTSDGFEALASSSLKKAQTGGNAAETQLIQQLKKRVERKMEAIRKLTDLTSKYIELFHREASRAATKIIALSEKKKDRELDLTQRRRAVFNIARGQVMAQFGREQPLQRVKEEEAEEEEGDFRSRPNAASSLSSLSSPSGHLTIATPEPTSAYTPNKVMIDTEQGQRRLSSGDEGTEDEDDEALRGSGDDDGDEDDAGETMSVVFPEQTSPGPSTTDMAIA